MKTFSKGHSSASSFYGRNPFGQTATSASTAPFGTSPEKPKNFPTTRFSRGAMKNLGNKYSEKNRATVTSNYRADSAHSTREVVIGKSAIFRTVLGEWEDSLKSAQKALGVTIRCECFSLNF